MGSKARLGVNIDHIATLRQARGEAYPSLVEAASLALETGADQITIHLREDRRHIQDTDVPAIKMVTERFGKPLNLELGTDDDIIQLALEVKPQWLCFVPEKREEITTQGGLNLHDIQVFTKVERACKLVKKKIPETKISLFVEADEQILKLCQKLPVDAVEIHTGDYAKDVLEENPIQEHLDRFKACKSLLNQTDIAYHAGHGLTDESLRPLVDISLFDEFNIGHWIICDSVFCGLGKSIEKLLKIIEGNHENR